MEHFDSAQQFPPSKPCYADLASLHLGVSGIALTGSSEHMGRVIHMTGKPLAILHGCVQGWGWLGFKILNPLSTGKASPSW